MNKLILVLEALSKKLEEGGQAAAHPYVVFALPFSVLLGLFLNPEESIREFFCFLVETILFPLPSTPPSLKLSYLLDQLAINSGGFFSGETLYFLFSYVSQIAILGTGIKIWKLVKW